LAHGKTISEARNLKYEDLVEAVGGLPNASSHAAQLALDALSAALAKIKRV
jgi:NifU-like protein involved in Fe-S cluster formation